MKITLIVFFTMLLSGINAQPINWQTIKRDCEDYELNPKKVKIRLSSEYAPLELMEIKVDIPEPLYIEVNGCFGRLDVVSESVSIEKKLEEIIASAFTKRNMSTKFKMHVRDIRIIYNELPTDNPRLYVTTDFYSENIEKEFELKYSGTEFTVLYKYLEKPLAGLLKKSITEFQKYTRYNNLYSFSDGLNSGISGKGVYASFIDLASEKPNYQYEYVVEMDMAEKKSGELRSKYQLLDEKKKKVNNPIYCYSTGTKTYLNVNFYYPSDYFVEMDRLNKNYYFIYDKIFDYTYAAKKDQAYGGGLLGNILANASATNKSPGIIDVKTGKLRTFTKKQMMEFLGDGFENYQLNVDNHKRDQISQLFKEILEDDVKKRELFRTNFE